MVYHCVTTMFDAVGHTRPWQVQHGFCLGKDFVIGKYILSYGQSQNASLKLKKNCSSAFLPFTTGLQWDVNSGHLQDMKL